LIIFKLRPACVELSSAALKFRTRQNQPSDVQITLDNLYSVLEPLGNGNALDAKLAEYVFFPLSQVFNESQALSQRCLELAVKCITVLVAKGWRLQLAPELGKQLLILLTILIGGTPAQNRGQAVLKPESEELSVASFYCMDSIFQMLQGPVAEKTIFNEIGSATIIDQTVYLLLEGITEGASNAVQIAAILALRSLFSRVTDRIILGSIMPRVVSALTKIIKPTTRTRRNFKVLEGSLRLLQSILRDVLNDKVVYAEQQDSTTEASSDKAVLDEAWLKATTGQIKLALANVIQIRQHERQAVRGALLDLCLMIVEDCPKSLKDSLSLAVETMVVLSEIDDGNVQNDAYTSLLHLATVQSQTVDTLKDLLHTWTTSFQRVMQSNDEAAKQRAIKQITTAFQVLSQVQSSSHILESSIALGLCDSVAAVVLSSKSGPIPVSSSNVGNMELAVVDGKNVSQSFPPVILEHRSQQQTLTDMKSMILRLNRTQSSEIITRFIMNNLHQASGDTIIAPFWLALQFLRSEGSNSIDEFLSFDTSASLTSRTTMVEELYSVALPILNEPPTTEQRDWRVSALGLEAVALQAKELGEDFRPELIDALYPVLQFLASNNPNLQNHAMACLNIITYSCNYPDTRTMLIENVDYLVNAVALKLNTFDVSPYPPQVLLMMVKLSGAGLIPYLDDLVASIFGILDMYHGYPKLVELLYSSLAAIVEEGTKAPAMLAISEDAQKFDLNRGKQAYEPLPVAKVVDDIARRKTKRARIEELDADIDEEHMSFPKRPWTRELDGPPLPKDDADDEDQDLSEENLDALNESDEPLPPPKEPEDAEKPLSKSHNLLLQIVKSIPPHLSSPSPFLRRSLLSLLNQALPVLSRNQTSFLPLINELWPPVSSRIAPPSAASSVHLTTIGGSSSSSTSTDIISRATANKHDDSDMTIKEETFVTDAACNAVASMCEFAGDFMASRVEVEYPRWRRLYKESWNKVLVDAEQNLERRQRSEIRAQKQTGHSSSHLLDLTPSSNTSRSFTQHHIIWRALLTLFVKVLSHVRLPLAVGDEICEFVGAWITKFMGAKYYHQQQQLRDEEEKGEEDINLVRNALQAMEAWNKDLTWFIFWQGLVDTSASDDRWRLPEKLQRFNDNDGGNRAWRFTSVGTV
jgi:TELO2-interacting protein 1